MPNDAQIQDLKTVIQRLREQNETLSQNLEHANQLIVSSQQQGTAFNSEKQALEQKNATLANEKNALLTEKVALEQRNNAFESEKRNLDQRIANLINEKMVIEQQLNEFKSRLITEKEKLQAKFHELNDKQLALQIEEQRKIGRAHV